METVSIKDASLIQNLSLKQSYRTHNVIDLIHNYIFMEHATAYRQNMYCSFLDGRSGP